MLPSVARQPPPASLHPPVPAHTTPCTLAAAAAARQVSNVVLARGAKLCNFVDWKDQKVVYKRYASLYFVAGIDQGAAVQ